MDTLLNHIANCSVCQLPLGPKPVLSAHLKSKIVIIGQAPGTKVHESGIPWDDKSGDNLRSWLGVSKDIFYNSENFAIIPMGFCYPGKGKTGDLPPKKECAPLWHKKLMDSIENVELVLLIGKYAQDYYLKDNPFKNLTETVENFNHFLPNYFVLPHPSPRNNIWQAKNTWFQRLVLPELKHEISNILS